MIDSNAIKFIADRHSLSVDEVIDVFGRFLFDKEGNYVLSEETLANILNKSTEVNLSNNFFYLKYLLDERGWVLAETSSFNNNEISDYLTELYKNAGDYKFDFYLALIKADGKNAIIEGLPEVNETPLKAIIVMLSVCNEYNYQMNYPLYYICQKKKHEELEEKFYNTEHNFRYVQIETNTLTEYLCALFDDYRGISYRNFYMMVADTANEEYQTVSPDIKYYYEVLSLGEFIERIHPCVIWNDTICSVEQEFTGYYKVGTDRIGYYVYDPTFPYPEKMMSKKEIIKLYNDYKDLYMVHEKPSNLASNPLKITYSYSDIPLDEKTP